MPAVPDDVTFRRATTDDIEALVEMRVLFLNDYKGFHLGKEPPHLRGDIMVYLEETLPSGEFVGWVAERGGEIIATGGMVVYRLPPGFRRGTGKVGYILNMYTEPEARRMGMGKRILDDLVDEGRKMGLLRVNLHASPEGEGIYRRAGFVPHEQPELELELQG